MKVKKNEVCDLVYFSVSIWSKLQKKQVTVREITEIRTPQESIEEWQKFDEAAVKLLSVAKDNLNILKERLDIISKSEREQLEKVYLYCNDEYLRLEKSLAEGRSQHEFTAKRLYRCIRSKKQSVSQCILI